MTISAELKHRILHYFGLSESTRVDGSHEFLKDQLSAALLSWVGRPAQDLHIIYTFPDRVIAYAFHEQLSGDAPYREPEIYEIPWQMDGEKNITFGEPVQVRAAQLYEPIEESDQPKGRKKLEEVTQNVDLVEASSGLRYVKAVGITADVLNRNRRRYPRAVLAEALTALNTHLHESSGQGKLLNIATGEVEHPSDKGGHPNLLETVIIWKNASLDSTGRVLLEGAIVPTSKGKDVQALLEAGVPVGVSMRGRGSVRTLRENGETIEEVTQLTIGAFDLVARPSDPNGAILESEDDAPPLVEKIVNTGESNMDLEEQLAEAQRALEEANQKLEEGERAKRELEERKQKEAIEAAITENTKDLNYGSDLNTLFIEAVKAAAPASVEVVKSLVESKRREYDALFAKQKLAAMGKSTGGVQVLGPVFERDTGQPEYTRPSYELVESLRQGGAGHHLRDYRGETPAGIFAQRVLERFDKLYAPKLVQEAREFSEAVTTSDLNLPYAVARTVIEQAYPNLVAANIFDFGPTDTAPARVMYESYTGETGSYATVTDESRVASTTSFVQLAHKRLRPGSVVVTHSSGTPTYVEGTDYVVDYANGSFQAIATITNGQTVLVDYTYDAFREGEMSAIERAENTLTSALLDIAADRLAMEISSEAIVFSRAQLGYDAVNRTLANLVRMVRRKIDQGILYRALAAALVQTNNSGGTWTAASDAVSLLVERIGVAKTKVYNRFYEPTVVLMSITNADRLSNWDGFKVMGFDNARLTSAGFSGSVKGLPVFASPEFPDTFIVIANRELIMHRVFQPMVFKGPFPSFNNGKLVAAEQYYIEEYNGTFVPVNAKASYVKIV